jgi:Ca-activated chloride channel family protein
MSFFADFHFLQPQWLWLAVLLPLVGYLLGRRERAPAALASWVDPALLPHLLEGEPRRQRVPVLLALLAGALAIVALAGPSWDRQLQPLFAERAAQVVAVSMSQHMLARDVVPERLSRARYKVRDLYQANRDGLNGLIAYAGDAFLVAPLTADAHSVDDLLNALAPDAMPVDGDDAAAAIDMGSDAIVHAGVGGGSLVLITDNADKAAVAAAARARAAGVRVSVLGVGTAQGGPLMATDGGFAKDDNGAVIMAARDEGALRALAAAGGGVYAPMVNDRADIDTLRTQLRSDPSRAKATDAAAAEWQDRGAWFVVALLPLFAMLFRRGWLLLAVLMLAPLASPRADAQSVGDYFHNRDQRAAAALAGGDAAKARTLAQSPTLRAAAAYKAGDFATAAKDYAALPGSDAAYNEGNALAKAGSYKEALAAYDRAIRTQPGHADAIANKKAVEDFLKQQNQQKPQDDKKNNKGQQKESSSGQGDGKNEKNQQGSDGKDGKNQPSPGKDGKPDDKPGEQGDKKPADNAPKDNPSGDAKDGQGKPEQKSAEDRAREQAQADAAKQALKDKMDKELAGKPDGKTADKPHDLGAVDDAGGKPLPKEVRQALQRVPDDPGGLLRRKFMLEYQRRHGAAAPDQDP